MESAWLARMQACRLYACRLPTDAFRPHEVGGYGISDEPVEAVGREVIDDLMCKHAGARIELRITPSISAFWRQVASSTAGFSGLRLRNAAPDTDQLA
jgi:hypothetical protein